MRNRVTAVRACVAPGLDDAPLLRLLPEPHRGDRHHADVAGAELDELVRRLAGEPIAFSLAGDGTWSAMSLTGEYSAYADTLDELVDELLEVLPT